MLELKDHWAGIITTRIILKKQLKVSARPPRLATIIPILGLL
jgi:hypothetical protein